MLFQPFNQEISIVNCLRASPTDFCPLDTRRVEILLGFVVVIILCAHFRLDTGSSGLTFASKFKQEEHGGETTTKKKNKSISQTRNSSSVNSHNTKKTYA
jgi:hypothetical protein